MHRNILKVSAVVADGGQLQLGEFIGKIIRRYLAAVCSGAATFQRIAAEKVDVMLQIFD